MSFGLSSVLKMRTKGDPPAPETGFGTGERTGVHVWPSSLEMSIVWLPEILEMANAKWGESNDGVIAMARRISPLSPLIAEPGGAEAARNRKKNPDSPPSRTFPDWVTSTL